MSRTRPTLRYVLASSVWFFASFALLGPFFRWIHGPHLSHVEALLIAAGLSLFVNVLYLVAVWLMNKFAYGNRSARSDVSAR